MPSTAAPASPIDAASPYRLVAFDFDGTLADTFGWFVGVLDEVADRFDLRRIAAHDIETLRGMDARQIIRHLGIPAWKLPLISRHMHALAARDIVAIRLFDGVPAMLDAMAGAGITLAVVSSNTEPNIRTVLGARSSLFARFSCGASLFGKARRLRAMAKAVRLSPRDILVIGDEIRDLEAAREAGCAFAAVSWGFTDRPTLAASLPDRLFDDPAQIAPALFSGLLGETMPRSEAAAGSRHR